MSRRAEMMGSYWTWPMPGPRRLGSLAWKWARYLALARMMVGMGVGSEDMALTSRWRRKWGWLSFSISSMPSEAVWRKSVSVGPRGSMARVTLRAAAWSRVG